MLESGANTPSDCRPRARGEKLDRRSKGREPDEDTRVPDEWQDPGEASDMTLTQPKERPEPGRRSQRHEPRSDLAGGASRASEVIQEVGDGSGWHIDVQKRA